MDNKISLAIFGNQNSNSGFQPLYWINNPPEQLENLVPPGMDENPYFFTLQVLPSHTQYTLIQNRVSSYMSSRAGVLKMAIAIPKGYCISGGISPMQVLLQVREKFIETCMTLRDAHAEAYNFKEKLPPPDDFVNIVDSYHLAITPKPHLPMSGTEEALMLLDDEAIALLFNSPHHPEFHPFKSIVIANKGNVAAYKTQLKGIVGTAGEEALPGDDSPTLVNKNIPSVPQSGKKFAFTKTHLIALLVLVAIGVGAFLLFSPSSHDRSSSDSALLADSDEDMYEEEEEEENTAQLQLAKDIKLFTEMLDNDTLTFDQITLMAAWAERPLDSSIQDEALLAQYDDLQLRIVVYDSLRTLLDKTPYDGMWPTTKREFNKISETLDSALSTGLLTDMHYHYLQATIKKPVECNGGPNCLDSIGWVSDNKDNLSITQRFLTNRAKGKYHSFKDVYDIALGRTPQPVTDTAPEEPQQQTESRAEAARQRSDAEKAGPASATPPTGARQSGTCYGDR